MLHFSLSKEDVQMVTVVLEIIVSDV